MNEQIEKQAIEEMAKVIEITEHIAEEMVGARPSPTMYAKDLYWHGYRKLSDFLQMVENICMYEERLSYQTIEEGIKRQIGMKGGAEEAPQNHFSPEDVRKMSSREVRENFTAIMESMKEWK